MARPPNPRREFYIEHFNLALVNPRNRLPVSLLEQLDACKDDDARRILLGISEEKEREDR